MSKRSKKLEGYILLESLIALGLLCLVIGSYFSLNLFLLKKKKEVSHQLLMQQVLYEELRHYENYEGQEQRIVYREEQIYHLHFYKQKEELIKVEITNGKETFTLKKE
ncbi:competence type IV pilus minor pilin ComGE [Candidatus Enterococcus mansonii]|uniref:Type II secretion system protein n=1 Tax=Candidatus Enterococcus mansonii TaxID=1834181 RepID=A0A242CHY3_9ENTE|nr:competence type IV pilus minor pilin ComGE [Enterococcus sp. 4G2_DIV0659]OTO09853.1 hypothetical protein A5880_000536 [Enterococcus sp. 4G2_DIV0659]